MPIKRSQPPSKRTKSSSSRSSLKPSLLPLSTKVQQTKAKKSGKNKSRDADVREKLDEASRVELRAALEVQPKTPLIKKKEVPVELSQGGAHLASSLDDLSVAFGAA